MVSVRFDIRVPASTPLDASIFVAGSAPSMGSWDAAGLPAQRVGERRYQARAKMESGQILEFKITRGSWESVEVMAAGTSRQNRHRTVQRSLTVPVTVTGWQDQKHLVRGPVGLNEQHDLRSRYLYDGQRHLMIHLPPGYHSQTNRRYPVLIMHDGQNLYDDSTSFTGVKWAVDEAVDRLVSARRMEPIIVAGVWNSPARIQEYHPNHEKAQLYARFLVEELLPWMEARYRLCGQRTGTAGSSMGGIVSVFLAEHCRETFTRIGAVSPSIWAGGKLMRKMALRPISPRERRFWLDMGTLEGGKPAIQAARRLRDLLEQAGWGQQLKYREIDGGRHHEWDWSRRMPEILEHLYPPL